MKEILHYAFLEKLKALAFIDEIWLFGSRAREDHLNRSDIDLAIICPKATDADWLKIVTIIENADTLLKIDCIRLDRNRLDDALYKNIVQDKKVIYVKNPH